MAWMHHAHSSVAVCVHELGVGLGKAVEGVVHGVFSGKKRSAEVQGSVLLPEAASRHKHDARFVQNLFGGGGGLSAC